MRSLRARWRRMFPGRWTQAEVDDINRRAAERRAALEPFID